MAPGLIRTTSLSHPAIPSATSAITDDNIGIMTVIVTVTRIVTVIVTRIAMPIITDINYPRDNALIGIVINNHRATAMMTIAAPLPTIAKTGTMTTAQTPIISRMITAIIAATETGKIIPINRPRRLSQDNRISLSPTHRTQVAIAALRSHHRINRSRQ